MGLWKKRFARVGHNRHLGQDTPMVYSGLPDARRVLQLVGHPGCWSNHTILGKQGKRRRLDGKGTAITVGRGCADRCQIGLLLMSASIISSSVYFLWRITTFPEIDNVDAILIGIAIACVVILCTWGIGSGRGNPVESSLLVRSSVFDTSVKTIY